jgi:hypothetical protein
MIFRRVAYRLVMAEDLDALVLREHARDLGIDPWDRSELAWPIGLVVRPGDPGSAVPVPLGGGGEWRHGDEQ